MLALDAFDTSSNEMVKFTVKRNIFECSNCCCFLPTLIVIPALDPVHLSSASIAYLLKCHCLNTMWSSHWYLPFKSLMITNLQQCMHYATHCSILCNEDQAVGNWKSRLL